MLRVREDEGTAVWLTDVFLMQLYGSEEEDTSDCDSHCTFTDKIEYRLQTDTTLSKKQLTEYPCCRNK